LIAVSISSEVYVASKPFRFHRPPDFDAPTPEKKSDAVAYFVLTDRTTTPEKPDADGWPKTRGLSPKMRSAAKEDLEAKIAYRYRIDSSLDKTTWEPIADGSENREFREVYEHTISKRLARYIRLTTLPHPDLKDHQARPKIAEILVYGAK
jgi:hypothetical protein